MAANKLTNFTKVLHKTDRASEVLVFDGDGNTSSIKPDDLVVGTATKLENPVQINFAGDIQGVLSFDGSEDFTVVSDVTVKDNSHKHTIANVTNLQTELDGKVDSVNGYGGDVVLDKSDIGLSNVTNDAQLKVISNLSDVPNKSVARSNLGLSEVASTGDFSDMSGEVVEAQLSSELVAKVNDTLPYNVNATSPPTPTDDSTQGWVKGSLWIDTVGQEAYRCVDSGVGSAVWINTTLTTSELSNVALSGSYADLNNKPSNATESTFGFMSAQDKTKLNSIEQGAEVNTVTSVNGSTGSVVLNTDNVSEGASNQYFTTTRARNSISVSGDLTYNSGVISFNETYSTPAEVKTAYESNANTNVFTDSEKTKLGGIEAGAEVNDVGEAPINGNQYTRQDGGWTVLDVPEGYTSANFNIDFNSKSTDDLSEGTNNLYYTDLKAANAAPVQSVSGKVGNVSLTSSDVGLNSVRNVASYSQTESDNLLSEKVDLSNENSVFEYQGAGLIVRTLDNNGDFIFQARSSGLAPRFTVEHGVTELKGSISGGWQIGTNPIWHAGNDGHGSGLDADTIDGYQAQDFAYPNQPQIANITLTGDFA